MSATRDKNQKPAFTFASLPLKTILKVGQMEVKAIDPKAYAIEVREYQPMEFLQKRQKHYIKEVESLKSDLHSLSDLQKKMQFLLKEIETILDPPFKKKK